MPDIDMFAVMANVNYFSAVLAAIAGFAFSVAWNSVLAPQRAALGGRLPEGGKLLKLAALAFAVNFIIAVALYGVMLHMSVFNPGSGAFTAVMAWAGFTVTVIAVNYASFGFRPALFFLDAGHWLAVLMVQGAVLGLAGM